MKGAKSADKKKDTKLSVKRKAAEKPKVTKKAKAAAKDPNKPKRPPSAFFVFMEDFRKTFKEKNPNNKSVSVVGKAGGDKWKSLTDAEKAPYQAKATKLKSEYTTKINAYNKKQTEAPSRKPAPVQEDDDEEESDKSKSEINDDEDDDEDEEEEDDD